VKILLAEDDTNLRETIAEVLRGQGYDVTAVPNGAAAVEALGGEPFDGAILDGLLPKMTGFDVAKQIKANSPRTGIILVSGVFKSAAQQQDQIKVTGAKAFLTKPFEVQRLLDALKPFAPPPSPQRVAGPGASPSGGHRTPVVTRETPFGGSGGGAPVVEQQPIPAEGNLLETPPMYLGWRLQREQHTGILELFGATARGRIFVYKGRAVFAQHSDPLLHVGVALLKDGLITPEQFKQAQDLAVARAVGIFDVLKGEGMATEAQLKLAYKGLVPQIIERLAALSGRYRWTATDAFVNLLPSASASLVDCLLLGVGKATEKDLDVHVAPRRPLRLAPGDCWDEVTALLASTVGSDSLTRAINGRATIAQLLEVSPTPKEKLARLRQVYVLMSTMAVRASLEPIPMARPAAAAPSAAAAAFVDDAPAAPAASSTPSASTRRAAAASDVGVAFSAEEQEARARIAAKASELEGKNHWQVLGVEQSADAAALKKAYFALSRDFHPDSFAGLNLGAAQQQLETIFATIQEAYAVLSDPNKRGEYEAKVKLEQGGGSSDLGAIFAAESDFNRIKNLVERGELAGAQKLIGKVAAVLGTSEEARGYKLFLDWWAVKNVTTAPAIIKELQELHKAAPAAHALAEFQGWIYLETGNAQKARAAFKRVLDVEPRNVGAERGLRAANKKQEELDKAAQGGGLGKLFKR
jgi:CheY-like chemotaxis protein